MSNKSLDVRKKLMKEYAPCMFDVSHVEKIPFGVFILDYLTDGGIPKGRITTVWGDRSSSKTSTVLRAVNGYLISNPNERVLYMDLEKIDPRWLGNFIPDWERRLEYVAPIYGEQCIDIMVEYAKAEDIKLIIVDSIGAMVPIAEADSSAMDNHVGMHARMVNKLLKKMTPFLGMKELTLILINHVTVDIGQRAYQPMMKKTGGKRQELLSCLDIRFYPGKYRRTGKTKTPISVTHKFTVEKNKVGLPKRHGEYTMYLLPYAGRSTGQVEELDTIVTYAKRVGVISRNGKGWAIGKEKFSNQAEFTEHLRTNESAFNNVKLSTLDKLYDHKVQEDEGEEDDTE